MSDTDNKIISFEAAKARRKNRTEIIVENELSEFRYEYNLMIKVTHQGKIHAIFQAHDGEVPEYEQIQHLTKILDVLKADCDIPF